MNSQTISDALDSLQVNKRRQIRGKNRAINKIHSDHLKAVDSQLMDIRIYVAKISVAYKPADIIKMIDEFIYQKQVK